MIDQSIPEYRLLRLERGINQIPDWVKYLPLALCTALYVALHHCSMPVMARQVATEPVSAHLKTYQIAKAEAKEAEVDKSNWRTGKPKSDMPWYGYLFFVLPSFAIASALVFLPESRQNNEISSVTHREPILVQFSESGRIMLSTSFNSHHFPKLAEILNSNRLSIRSQIRFLGKRSMKSGKQYVGSDLFLLRIVIQPTELIHLQEILLQANIQIQEVFDGGDGDSTVVNVSNVVPGTKYLIAQLPQKDSGSAH
jgi:hypothetical protein